jgi:hypothetical protein
MALLAECGKESGLGKLRYILVVLVLLSVGALFGGSLYDTLVLAPNLQGGPEGLEHGRLFMSVATPGDFFRAIAPASQILLLLAVVASWRSTQLRGPLLIALVSLVLADVVTFTYHYPRNAIMFTAPLAVEPARLSAIAKEWRTANYLRVFLVLTAWLSILTALTRTIQQRLRSGEGLTIPMR